MKAILLISVFTLTIVNLFGQVFPSDSAFWKVEYSHAYCLDPYHTNAVCWQQQYFLEEDTIIENKGYNKLFSTIRHRDPLTNTWTFIDEGYIGAIRSVDSTNQIFYLPGDEIAEELLYDFKLEIGDTLPESYVYDPLISEVITIDAKDTIEIEGKKILRLHMDNAGFGEQYLLQGIGSTLGLLEPIEPWFEQSYALLCFQNHEAGLTYYPEWGANCDIFTDVGEKPNSTPLVVISPNPTKGKVTILLNKSSYEESCIRVLDVSGRILIQLDVNQSENSIDLSSWENGLYLIRVTNGNKLIWTEKLIKI